MLLKGLNKKRHCTRNNDYNLCECYLYPSMRKKKKKRHLAKRSYNYGLPCPEKSREKEWDERYKHQPNNVQVAMVQKKKRNKIQMKHWQSKKQLQIHYSGRHLYTTMMIIPFLCTRKNETAFKWLYYWHFIWLFYIHKNLIAISNWTFNLSLTGLLW